MGVTQERGGGYRCRGRKAALHEGSLSGTRMYGSLLPVSSFFRAYSRIVGPI
jgi:hypothetical protein